MPSRCQVPGASPEEEPCPLQGRDEPKPIRMLVRALLLLEVFQIHSAKPFPPRSSAPRAGSDAHNYGAPRDADSRHEQLGTATKGWCKWYFSPPPIPLLILGVMLGVPAV